MPICARSTRSAAPHGRSGSTRGPSGSDELRVADAEAPARIASEFTPTQILTLADIRSAAERTTQAPAGDGDGVESTGSLDAGGAAGAGED